MQPFVALVAAGKVVPAWADLPTELHLRTCSMLEIFELSKLSQTSKYHRSLYSEVFGHRLRVLLGNDFNLPVKQLTLEMRRSRAIILGALPASIVNTELPTPYEIDFCVPLGALQDFEQFLLTRTTYGRIKHDMMPLYPTGSDSGIVQIVPFRDPKTQRVLRIIEAELKTATSVVFLLPVTAAMTYVTWNAVVAPYPFMLHRRVSLLNTFRSVPPIASRRFVSKFKRMGFQMHPDAGGIVHGHACGSHPCCAQTSRKISDGASMMVRWNANLAPIDPIDPKLEWRLSSSYRCSGFKHPSGAHVSPGTGESIDVEVNFNRGTFEAMTVIRLKDKV